MNTLIEQTVRFLSKSNSPYIHEKSLTPDEIEDLMDKGEEVSDAIANDSKKDPDERETAEMFLVGSMMLGQHGKKRNLFTPMW